jgi:hypothetical protein
MKTTLLIISLLICLLCVGATYQSAAPRQFEYKFEFNPSEKKANELGALGWELVAIQSTGPGTGNNIPTYVFRRVK